MHVGMWGWTMSVAAWCSSRPTCSGEVSSSHLVHSLPSHQVVAARFRLLWFECWHLSEGEWTRGFERGWGGGGGGGGGGGWGGVERGWEGGG